MTVSDSRNRSSNLSSDIKVIRRAARVFTNC